MPPDDDIGTGEVDPGQGGEPVSETPEPSTTPDDSFVRGERLLQPHEMSDEIRPHYQRMQSVFTKKMQAFKGRDEDMRLVDQYRQNPEFAKQFLLSEAQRLGVTLPGTGTGTTQANTPAAPAEFVQAFRQNLPAELQWMADSMAPAMWQAQQATMRPVIQQSQEREAAAREREYDQHAATLADRAPGWEEHEDDMDELLKFLENPAQQAHPKYGSKLDILYGVVTGNASAIKEATRRMGQAARARTVTGQTSRTTIPNVEERVKSAKNLTDAFDAAAEYAVNEMKRQGRSV